MLGVPFLGQTVAGGEKGYNTPPPGFKALFNGNNLVWYYRGAPHVHNWILLADNPETPVTSHFG